MTENVDFMKAKVEKLLSPFLILIYSLGSLIGIAFVGKLLVLGYLMSHGIYPYDFFASSTPLFALYFVLGGLFLLISVALYGWLCVLVAEKSGKSLPIPRWGNWLLIVTSTTGHIYFLSIDLSLAFGKVTIENQQNGLELALAFTAPAGLVNMLLSFVATLLLFSSVALLSVTVWLGGFKDYVAARSLLVLVGTATLLLPTGGSALAGFAMQSWGIGGGLKVNFQVGERKIGGRLVLLGPDYVYIEENGARTNVGIWQRKDLHSLKIDQSRAAGLPL